MTVPTLLFALLLALLIGALFHLWRGGGGGKLLLYLVLSVLGFAAGHFLAVWRGWSLLRVGSLEAGVAGLGSLLFLAVGEWLSMVNVTPPDDSQV
ncbi:MAG: hypothetical protein AB1564_00355 [Chloroflexota bacterium]